MRRLEGIIAVVGVGLGVWMLVVALLATPAEQPIGQTTPPQPATTVTEIVAPIPTPPIVDGLPAAVAGVLAERGHTELLDRPALLAELLPNVIAVLIERNVVLTIAEEDALP